MTGCLTGYFLSVGSELEGPGHEGDQVCPSFSGGLPTFHSFILSGFFELWKHAYNINYIRNTLNSHMREVWESINAVIERSLY